MYIKIYNGTDLAFFLIRISAYSHQYHNKLSGLFSFLMSDLILLYCFSIFTENRGEIVFSLVQYVHASYPNTFSLSVRNFAGLFFVIYKCACNFGFMIG